MWFFLSVALVVGCYYYMKTHNLLNEKDSAREESFRILNERYARGEIKDEEYEKMKENINTDIK